MPGCAADQDVNRVEFRQHFRRRGRDVALDADIAGDREGAPAAFRGLRGGRRGGCRIEIDAGDLRAGAGEGERNGAADAGARAGDHGGLAFKRIGIIHGAPAFTAARPRYASRTRVSLASSAQLPLTMMLPVCST